MTAEVGGTGFGIMQAQGSLFCSTTRNGFRQKYFDLLSVNKPRLVGLHTIFSLENVILKIVWQVTQTTMSVSKHIPEIVCSHFLFAGIAVSYAARGNPPPPPATSSCFLSPSCVYLFPLHTCAKSFVGLETLRYLHPFVTELLRHLRGGVEERRLERREHEGETAQDGEARRQSREARQGVVGAVVVVEQQGLRSAAESPEAEEHHSAEHSERYRHCGPGRERERKI